MAPPAGPLVLFDGVCNLCNAFVQWLIERDPHGRLRFASLQSEAARAALADAGVETPDALPDSLVLVDGAGVHVESGAALRIAGVLGFPYRLAPALLLIPRPLRDAVYRAVARNRYRWFGRRQMCLRPTPDLVARFLDAGEPERIVPDHDPRPAARPAGLGRSVKAWLTRLPLAYLLLYMIPFPLTLLNYLFRMGVGDVPGIGAALQWTVGLPTRLINALTVWAGTAVFDVTVSLQGTGSGDRTYDFVRLAVTAALALIVTTVWTTMVRARPLSPRTFDVSRVLARYFLATVLLSYGYAKAFPLQFPAPGPDRLLQSFGDASPMGLAWTFFGASSRYEIFGGLMELLAGYLLFWRRTALLGALVGIVVLANVMAINYFFDVPVKLYSTHLALVAVFIAAPDLPRLVGLFGFNLPAATDGRRPFWFMSGRRRGWLMAAHLLLVGTITYFHVGDGIGAVRAREAQAASPMTGVFVVESFDRDGVLDRANADADRWVRVGITAPGLIAIQRATGVAVRMRMALDEKAGTLSAFDRGGQPPEVPQFTYTLHADGRLRLEGTFEGARLTVHMRKSPAEWLLLNRGYHWINEYPFNR